MHDSNRYVPTSSHLVEKIRSTTPQYLHLVHYIEQLGLRSVVLMFSFQSRPETHIQAGVLTMTHQLLFRQHIAG
jgi:hypothetical protein